MLSFAAAVEPIHISHPSLSAPSQLQQLEFQMPFRDFAEYLYDKPAQDNKPEWVV